MQLMAELSGEQGSSADLLRRLEQAESRAAALEAKVQVLSTHCVWLLLCLCCQTTDRGLAEANLVVCGLIIESASKE